MLLMAATLAFGQNNLSVGQYFKIMPAFAPGLTGANGFLDIKVGSRNQSLGYAETLQTHYFSVNGILMDARKNPYKYNSLRVGNMSPYEEKPLKIGLGGYLIDDKAGEVKQIEGAISSAVHVLIGQDAYLSLGLSAGINSTKIDVSKLTVRNPDRDKTYNAYLANGYRKNSLKSAVGLAVYSNQYYLSYSMMTLFASRREQYLGATDKQIAHHIIGSYSFSADAEFEIIPNFHLSKVERLNTLLELGTRIRYQHNAYAGISYRTNNSFIAMLGFAVNNLIDVGYSFESAGSNATFSTSGTHEIVVGLRLFNDGKYVPVW